MSQVLGVSVGGMRESPESIRTTAVRASQCSTETDRQCPFSCYGPAMAPAEPRERKDVVRNRQRILDAAKALFAERGLSVTLHDIARHAGVGVGTIYRHYPDKAVLIDLL